MTLPGRPPRLPSRKRTMLIDHTTTGEIGTCSSSSALSNRSATSPFGMSTIYRQHHPYHGMTISPAPDELNMMMKPTEEEQIALEAIRRLGNEIDTAIALEFLRGPQFGDMGASSLSTSTSDRGLPPAAVSILKLWFLVHQSDPYPTKEEKERLMKETGLSMIQLKNWFSNIRKRHWHPIRTGSRRPRSHVEYVLLYGSSTRTSASPPDSTGSGFDDERSAVCGIDTEEIERPAKLQRYISVQDS